jgi:long-chain acyl-CoA synthetase
MLEGLVVLNSVLILEETARKFPDKTAVICGKDRTTYCQLQQMVNQLANGLKELGINSGDRVLMACPNQLEFCTAYFAILKIGAIAVTVNILCKQSELEYYLEDTKAKAFLCSQGTEKLSILQQGRAAFEKVSSCEHFIAIKNPGSSVSTAGLKNLHDVMEGKSGDCPTEPTDPDDTAVILYTSGTTGKPKGAELTHQNILVSARIFLNAQRVTPDDTHLVALPLFHCYSQSAQMGAGFLAGSTIVLMQRFEPDTVLRNYEQENITLFAGVPTMYWALLNKTQADDYNIEKISKNFRLGMSGGAAMPVEVLRGFENKFGIIILEAYGLTETTAAGTLNQIDMPRKIGSIGVPHPGIKMRVVDEKMQNVPAGQEGELVVRADCVMKGYYNDSEGTEQVFRGGWLHTGDVALQDEDGYFYIVDRLKDVIIRGGYNVYPREVEEKMIEHPDISLVAVIGVPHEQYGEEIMAFIILNEGATCTVEDIIAWTKSRLANYKYPRYIRFVDSIPMSATNKILKRELRKVVQKERG